MKNRWPKYYWWPTFFGLLQRALQEVNYEGDAEASAGAQYRSPSHFWCTSVYPHHAATVWMGLVTPWVYMLCAPCAWLAKEQLYLGCNLSPIDRAPDGSSARTIHLSVFLCIRPDPWQVLPIRNANHHGPFYMGSAAVALTCAAACHCPKLQTVENMGKVKREREYKKEEDRLFCL